jgi:hypothetical protein
MFPPGYFFGNNLVKKPAEEFFFLKFAGLIALDYFHDQEIG